MITINHEKIRYQHAKTNRSQYIKAKFGDIDKTKI